MPKLKLTKFRVVCHRL